MNATVVTEQLAARKAPQQRACMYLFDGYHHLASRMPVAATIACFLRNCDVLLLVPDAVPNMYIHSEAEESSCMRARTQLRFHVVPFSMYGTVPYMPVHFILAARIKYTGHCQRWPV